MKKNFFSKIHIVFLYLLIIAGMFVIYSFRYENDVKNEQEEVKPVTESGQRFYAPDLPAEVYFAGERIPLESQDVFERLDRELIVNNYWHSSTMLFIKRANRWFPLIEEILKKNNIPEDFKYIALIESNLTNVVSPAGATGFWQFMKAAGKQHGLEINDVVDERYHVEKATEAACLYLHEAYAEFGDWLLAAASYNMGITGVKNQLERQKAKSYFNLVLNDETSRYVPRAITAKIILSNPEKYGFMIRDDQLYKPYKFHEIPVNTGVDDLADFAFKYGINYRILKTLNPWLRDNYLTNKSRKEYLIKIPVEGSINIIED